MVDPNNRQLRPPIHRSWLRLRLGKLYYGGRRRLLWMSPRFHWAKQRQTERLPYMLISHATPLYRRHLRGEDQELQETRWLISGLQWPGWMGLSCIPERPSAIGA